MRTILAIIIILILTNTSYATNYCSSGNIVNCYPAQEGSGTTLRDKSVNSNNGTIVGSPAWQQSAPSRGYITYSLNFTTGSQWVTVPNTTFFKPSQAQSVVFWVYPTSNTYNRILDRAGDNILFSTSPAWGIAFGASAAGTALSVITAGSVITQNAWNHVAITWDGSQTASNVHIYINGTETTYSTQTNATGGLIDVTGSTMYLCNRSDGLRNLQGNITDIAFFNKVLSSGEISDIYNYGIGAINKSIINNATVNNATIN